MSNKREVIQYQSVLAPIINQLIQEKRVCGYKYIEGAQILKTFDAFLYENQLKTMTLPKVLVLQWLEKRSCEQPATQQRRICFVRQLATFMVRLGYQAYIVPNGFGTRRSWKFTPRIFTYEEIKKLIHAADSIKPSAWSPMGHIIIPEIFRLLYGCGFRVNEVLNLRIRDVDLKQGVITVRDDKFGKDRLVPPALDIVERLRVYAERLDKETLKKRTDNDFFFPSPREKSWTHSAIYFIFRKLLYQCDISHSGRGKGPRLHDFRHTFAVHRMIRWYEEGADLNAKLPLLVAYLGHKDFTGTQKYLRLTSELFPNLISRMNQQFGNIIPKGR